MSDTRKLVVDLARRYCDVARAHAADLPKAFTLRARAAAWRAYVNADASIAAERELFMKLTER